MKVIKFLVPLMVFALLLSLAACAHVRTAEPPGVQAEQNDSPAISPWAEPASDASIEEEPTHPQAQAPPP